MMVFYAQSEETDLPIAQEYTIIDQEEKKMSVFQMMCCCRMLHSRMHAD